MSRKKKTKKSAAERVTEAVERRSFIDRLNERYAVVRVGNKTVILDAVPGEPPEFMPVDDFHLWFKNDRVRIDDDKMIPVSALWIVNRNRRQFERVVFDPRDTNRDHYNLWRGFPIKPDPGKSCAKFLAHVRDNICSGDEGHYQWLLGFLAHMVQKPEEKPGVAPVLRGLEGVGKGFFAYAIARLISPENFVAISQSEHLTGRFNKHLAQSLLIFVDEGFWAGDKKGEGALKHLVTDTELLVEPKHVSAFMVKNLSRLIIAANAHWVVPAGFNARRWFVLDVASTRANDRAYFAAIDEELKSGGLEALMHLLLTFDLSTVDVYTAPKTAALLDQKVESAEPHERWWMQCLHDGEIKEELEDRIFGADRHFRAGKWPHDINKKDLWLSYKRWVEDHNIRARLWPDKQLFKWLKPLLPGYEEYRLGNEEKGRWRLIMLPGLEVCREAFESAVGQTVAWETEAEADGEQNSEQNGKGAPMHVKGTLCTEQDLQDFS